MKSSISKILSWILVCAMVLAQLLIPMPLQAQAASAVREADTDIQNGTTLHCWNWSYANIIEQLPTIAAQGFTSIQVSPIQKAKQPTMGSPVNDWWTFYQPAEFAIDNTGVNAMGTKADFMNLCETAHEYGIYVIVDVVANHMAADYNYSRSPAILDDIRNDNSCWHNRNSNINNYSSRENITQYDLDSVLDLNTGSKKIQTYVLNYLKKLIDAGADGFRFDAVKHIETPDDNASIASDFWPTVIYGAEDYAQSQGLDLYCYGELLDHPDNVNGLPDSAYAKYYSITDNVWGNNVRDSVVGSGNAGNFGGTYHKNVSADQLVLWAESHDTYAGGTSKGVSETNINKTWALVAARADAMSLYLTRTTGFTPPNALGTAYLSGWNVAEVAAANKFHNAFVGQSEYVANSGNIAYVERGTSGAVLVNVTGNGTGVNVKANRLANGTYKDQISGNTFTVSGGKITGTIGSTGIAVIYNVPSCSHASHHIAGLCANCGASVSHSYVGGVCACGKTKPVTGSCSHAAHRYNGVCRGCGSNVGHSYANGICSVCGVEKPVDTFAYYLTGYINGSNINEINETYRFKDSKLTLYSATDAYVSIRTYNGIYYQTSPDQQYNDTVILRNASMSNGSNAQMRIPGGRTVTLQLQSNYDGTYTLSYAEGGIVTPSGSANDYYLVGYINGANHGCEEDYANLGDYKFTDGKLTATFKQDSYVFVKTGDNNKWLLADSYCTDTSCTFSEGKSEKMFVPGGVEVTFTLTKNAGGSVTVSYTTSGDDSGSTDEPVQTRTIYVDTTGNSWSNVNVYTWDNKGNATTGTWPGSAMTKVAGNVYSYEVPTTAVNIIFNDGSSQTSDLIIPNNGNDLYTCKSALWSVYTTACSHSYTSKVTTAATCTAAGVKTFTCSKCGDSYTESIAATGHSYKSVVTAPTCTAAGYTTHTCSACGHSYIDKATAATGHSYVSGKCSVCGVAEPTCSHSYSSKVTTAATCDKDGVKTYTCTKCGSSYTETITATGHSYTAEVHAPNCTSIGYTVYTCGSCGYRYQGDYLDATPHTYSNGRCTACGAADPNATSGTVYYLIGYINGADYGCEADWQNMGNYKFVNGKLTAQFDQDSYIFIKTEGNGKWLLADAYCTGTSCTFSEGKSEKMFVPGNVKLTFTLKENSDGSVTVSYTKSSTSCSHSYSSKVTTPATCASDGVITYTCTKCGSSYTETVPATDHQFVNGSCTYCGAFDGSTPLAETYYLVGWINGADYGCESDYENNGIYKFVNGQLTAKFTQDSYVFVKTENNGRWLLADAYSEATICTFYEGKSEKMFVPGGVQLFFAITENEDGSVTVSYTKGGTTACDHSYLAEVTTEATCTTAGLRTYTCIKCNHSYTQNIAATGHNFFGGNCSVCGIADPSATPSTGTSYYLVGYINGADHGCEADWENLGNYRFTDGRLTVKFNQNSYVFVKTGDNKDFMLAPSYCEASTCTFAVGNHEKMFVPGNVELTFVLTENTDGTVSLTYTSGNTPASKIPTLTLKSPTLEFKDMITINAFYTAENTADIVEMGMITYTSKVERWSVRTAEHIVPGYTYIASSGRYCATSQGIHAKYLADTFYLATYAKLADGSYVYSKLAPYSPMTYANSQLKNATDVKLKQLAVAMLNYGAQAQLYFGHNTGNLANAALNAEHLALPESYRADMISSVPAVSTAKQGSFANNSGFSGRYPAISFEGAFCINYFFTPKYTPTSGITLYYWDAEDYSAASTLTTANATGSLKLSGSGTGEYRGDITGIAAKSISEAVYVAAVYQNGSKTWTSGVLGYSIGAYCSSQASKGGDIADLAMATAVYGYHAKQYFG